MDMSDSKRFYFDNGRSRKRWHVQTEGKTQIVEFGRPGAPLRASKKSFKSPAEAQEQTGKLIAKKKREGYIEINASRLEITRFKGSRKATDKQIKALETRIGCELPVEYRSFLKTRNGGRPNPDCVAIPGVQGIANVGVGALFQLQPSKPGVDELSYEFDRALRYLPAGHLPIAGSSDVFTLSLRPKSFGCVYWWFHESDDVDDDGNFLETAGHLLAGSFDEFLTRIALLHGDRREIEDEPAVHRVAARKQPAATIRQLVALVKHEHTPEKVEAIEQVVRELGDLSGIKDGEWPFINIDSPRVLRCLLDAGLNREMTDADQHSLLWQCAGNHECVDLLLERGARVDRRSGGDFETALMRAIYLEAIPAVMRLLQAGANPALRLERPARHKLLGNANLRTLIEQARAEWRENKGKRESAATRPQAAASGNKKQGPKPTIERLLGLLKHDYFYEGFDGFDEIGELITELGDLSGIQDGKWPNIDRFEDPRLLRSLLDAGLNPEITDGSGNSLLSQCVGNPECIDLLLERGVAVDRRSGRDHETALMRAAYKGDEECVERLLAAGADPTLEFSSFARVMLSMDRQMTAIIETARENWIRGKGKRESSSEPEATK
jgi:ankyrin repeat protein/predicted DNA-binding WGR domain protein